MTNAVVNWFGDSFSLLHPLLQRLHREGGELSGVITVEHGRGLAGFLGKRLAAKLGLPQFAGDIDFNVKITHSDDCLFWNRTFGHNRQMNSTFKPHGCYENGYWCEETGKLSLELGVEIMDGGWYWVQRKIRFCGFALPACLLPMSHAYKRVENECYLFSVSFSFPFLGQLLGYSGKLKAG